jgi:hypothetical protein
MGDEQSGINVGAPAKIVSREASDSLLKARQHAASGLQLGLDTYR